MKEHHLITREIGIDMGHRVTYHGSKCRNLHGHRYTIQATVAGPLHSSGEQEGMVLDYGFLKDIMMSEIDANCDHGTTLWCEDHEMLELFKLTSYDATMKIKRDITDYGFCYLAQNNIFNKMKTYIIPDVPTAENLARHWFHRLGERVSIVTEKQAWMHSIKVWETPNCSAIYPFPKVPGVVCK